MSLFFETIKVQNGVVYNLNLHNQRLNRTRRDFYHNVKNLDLKEYICPPKDNKLYRCKIVYGRDIKNVDFFEYHEKRLKKIKVVFSNIEYGYKYYDRKDIEILSGKRGECDDILIVDYHYKIRDTSIANIAVKKDGVWLTPKYPLLKGTIREKFLEDKIIIEKDLFLKDIENIESFAIMNAMIGFKIIKADSEKLFCK